MKRTKAARKEFRIQHRFALAGVVGLIALLGLGAITGSAEPVAADTTVLPSLPGTGPGWFEPNLGQWHPDVDYRAVTGSYTLFLAKDKAVMLFRETANSIRDPTSIHDMPATANYTAVYMRYVQSNPNPLSVATELQSGVSNYFIGNDPAKWRANVPHYGRITYHGVYPGADVTFYFTPSGDLKYDFAVAPGASTSSIKLRFEGADSAQVDESGALAIDAGFAELRHDAPQTYQLLAGQRTIVESQYHWNPDGTLGFTVGTHDPTRPLVIDPLVYSTYLGGVSCCGPPGYDYINDVASDSAGSSYVVGTTNSEDFPTTPGAFRSWFWGPSGRSEVFVTKMNADGSGLVYSTYLGGGGNDGANTIAVDATGAAYIAGYTHPADYPIDNFPVTNGAYDRSLSSNGEGFVVKLAPTGSVLVYSTYFGLEGQLGSRVDGIAVDAAGNAFFTGRGVVPATSGAYNTQYPTNYQGYVAKLGPTGSNLVYSTYLPDYGSAVDVDSDGNAYVVGKASYQNFPVTIGAFQACGSTTTMQVGSAYVLKLNPAGSALVYSTCLDGGGVGDEWAKDVAVDGAGNAYVVGSTAAPGFPTTAGAFRTSNPGGTNGFALKLNPTGTGLVYSTYLGGSGADEAHAVAVAPLGEAIVGGNSASTDYPVSGAVQSQLGGGTDGFVTKLNPVGTGLIWSTFLGGSADDYIRGVDAPTSVDTYFAGYTSSTNFPTTSGAFQPSFAGSGSDGFVAKFAEPAGQPQSLTAACPATTGVALSWLPSPNGGYTVLNYRVYRSSDGTAWTLIASPTSTSYTDEPPYQTAPYSYRVTSVNAAEEGPPSNTVEFATCDLVAPQAANHPLAWTWRDTTVAVTGATWTDPYSGLNNNTEYSVGTTLGGIDVRDWTPLPSGAQPTVGQTTAWNPTFTPSPLGQGQNYVNMRVRDAKANQVQTNGAYTIQYDTNPPTCTNCRVTYWTNGASYSVTGATIQDVHSGLSATAAYWIGSTPGGNDLKASAAIPSPPTSGQTAAWAANVELNDAAIQAGTSYVTIQVSDVLGHSANIDAYEVRVETTPPTVTGNPVATPWTNALPSLTGVTFQDTQSGLGTTFEYSVGTTGCGTDVLTWRALPVQPTLGQNTPWTPTWTPEALGQGTNYVNVRARDAVANVFTVCGAYTVEYDTGTPSAIGAPLTTPWTNNNPLLTGVSWSDPLSGLAANAEYSIGTTSGATDFAGWLPLPAGQQPTPGQTGTWTPSFTPPDLNQGTNYVNVRVRDRAGNVATTNGAYVVQYDTALPTSTGAVVVTPWTNVNPTLSGVTFQDPLSGLKNNARYWVGSTAGASDYLASTDLPVQPAFGQTTSWSPSFQIQPSALRQGDNHVTIQVTDRAGSTVAVQSHKIQFETVVPTVAGNPVAVAWTNTLPLLSGVSLQDVSSGLNANAQYSVGTTSGGENVRPWGPLTVQPSPGQTTPWNPSWTPGSLGQGLNFVNLRVYDRAGNLLTVDGAYTVQYETAAPTPSGNPQAWTWRNTIPTVSGVSWTDALSGLTSGAEYSVGTTNGGVNIVAWTSLPPAAQPTVGQTTAWNPSFAPASLGQGQNYVNVRVSDVAGNQAVTNGAYTIQYDTGVPTATGAPVVTPWVNSNPTLSGVCLQDAASGLQATAQYWLGSTAGAQDYLAPTAMSLQPLEGQTDPWCPSFQIDASALHQGSNHVTIRVEDRVGQALAVSAYEIRYDAQAESMGMASAQTQPGGAPIPNDAWQNDATPYFSWPAPTSTSPITGYSYSLSTTPSVVPDQVVDTTNTFLDRTGNPLTEGVWLFRVRSVDAAGNWGPASVPFTLRVDLTPPSLPALLCPTHEDESAYYGRTTLSCSWTVTDALSGLDGYSFDLVTGANPPALDATKDLEESPPSTTLSNLGPFNVYSFRVRGVDQAGNWGPAVTRTVRVDAVPPTILLPPVPAHQTFSGVPRQPVEVQYNETDNGFDVEPVATNVDVSTVKLFVDMVDVVAAWKDTCYPNGFLPQTACVLEVDAGHVRYEPLLPWTEGVHDLFLTLQDTAIDANTANLAWNFTAYSSTTVDPDGDRIPTILEGELCGRNLTRTLFNDPNVPGHCASNTNFVPPTTTATFFVPMNVKLGPDADQDGAPSTLTLQGVNLTLNPFRPGLARASPAPDTVVPADPNDADPNTPLLSVFQVPQPVPIGVQLGPDADHDGLPATVTVLRANVVVDRRNPTNPVTLTPASAFVIGVDSPPLGDDQDPNNPLSGVVGPVPIPIRVEQDGDHDNDYLPGNVTITWLDVTIDRTRDFPLVLGHHQTRLLVDENDGNRNAPVPFAAVDADGDLVADGAEFWICQVQNENTPDDGRCVQPDGTGADGSGPNYVPPASAPNPWSLAPGPSTVPARFQNPAGQEATPDEATQVVVDDDVPPNGAGAATDPVVFFQGADGSPATLGSGRVARVTIDPDGTSGPQAPIAAPSGSLVQFQTAIGTPTTNPAQVATIVVDSNRDGQFSTSNDAYVQFRDASGAPIPAAAPAQHAIIDADGTGGPQPEQRVPPPPPTTLNPRTATNPDGTCTVYNDGNNNGVPDAGEVATTQPCPRPRTATNPDGSMVLYDDKNNNQQRDPGETLVTLPAPPKPKVRDNVDGTCTVYNDADNDNVQDPGEHVSTFACVKPRLHANPDGSTVVYDDKNDNDVKDPGEAVATIPAPFVPPVFVPDVLGPVCGFLESQHAFEVFVWPIRDLTGQDLLGTLVAVGGCDETI